MLYLACPNKDTLMNFRLWTGAISLLISFVCLFDMILYFPSSIIQLCRGGSSWVEPILSLGLMCFAQGHNVSELLILIH